jgi:hypothetical protein
MAQKLSTKMSDHILHIREGVTPASDGILSNNAVTLQVAPTYS